MTQAAQIAELLGGVSLLRHRIRAERDLERAVREGLPAESVRTLAEKTTTPLSQLQKVMHLDRSTFARRVRSRTKLRADESDRVVRVARVAALAIAAMGNTDGLSWLHEPNAALGGRVPMELLDTDVGTRQVENIIGRIEYGVFS